MLKLPPAKLPAALAELPLLPESAKAYVSVPE